MNFLTGFQPSSVSIPNPNYTSKQPRDGVVPTVPCTGIFLGPSKSGKTIALISAILEQYRTADGSSVFERIYIFSPSNSLTGPMFYPECLVALEAHGSFMDCLRQLRSRRTAAGACCTAGSPDTQRHRAPKPFSQRGRLPSESYATRPQSINHLLGGSDLTEHEQRQRGLPPIQGAGQRRPRPNAG